MFLGKVVLKIRSRFTGEHPCQSVISIKLLKNGCSPVNLLHIFRIPFPKNTSEGLLLKNDENCAIATFQLKYSINFSQDHETILHNFFLFGIINSKIFAKSSEVNSPI